MENEIIKLQDPQASAMAMMKQLADNDPDALVNINGE